MRAEGAAQTAVTAQQAEGLFALLLTVVVAAALALLRPWDGKGPTRGGG